MCFLLRADDWGKEPKVAEKDIKVWKVIQRDGFGMIYSLRIDGKIEKWTRGWHYYETTPFHKKSKRKVQGHAFHGKKRRDDARQICGIGKKVVEMIIPKGALYYENYYEYVSSQIIYPEIKKK